MMVGFPLLLIPVAIYNIIVFLMPGVSFVDPVTKLTLMSGAEWPLTLSDALLALGILMRLVEVIKGARPGAKYPPTPAIVIVFVGAAANFVVAAVRQPTISADAARVVDFLFGVALRRRRGVAIAPAAAVVGKALETLKRRRLNQQFEPAPRSTPVAAPSAPPPAFVAEIRAAGSPCTGPRGKRRIAGMPSRGYNRAISRRRPRRGSD